MPIVHARAILEQLRGYAQDVSKKQRKPKMLYAIFDIDGTLLDPFPRHLAVYEQILQPHFHLPPARDLDLASKPYFLPDLIPAMKKDTQEYKEAVEMFLKHFLSPEFLDLDPPIAGSIQFLTEVRKMGLGIIYLTSRHLGGPRSMADKTIEVMGDLGYPISPSNEVLFAFKPDTSTEDLMFKSKFVEKFKANKYHDSIFVADNETQMCEMFKKEFPAAIVVRFDSAQSHDVAFDGPTITSWNLD